MVSQYSLTLSVDCLWGISGYLLVSYVNLYLRNSHQEWHPINGNTSQDKDITRKAWDRVQCCSTYLACARSGVQSPALGGSRNKTLNLLFPQRSQSVMLARMLPWQAHKFSYILFPKVPLPFDAFPAAGSCLELLSSIESQQCSSNPVAISRVLSSKPHQSLSQGSKFVEEDRGRKELLRLVWGAWTYLITLWASVLLPDWAHRRFDILKWKWPCIPYFSCYDQMPDKSNLREEGLSWLLVWKDTVYHRGEGV